MKRILFLVTIIVLFVINSEVYSKDWERILNLKGRWKFSIGDEKEWMQVKYNDQNWEEIYVPSSWEEEGFNGYDGYGWYRKHFKCPAGIVGKSIYLFLGYIDDVDEVYVNGTLIGFSGTFPPGYQTAYNAFRRYPIPENLLKVNQENVIAVRVYDSQLGGGIVSGDIGLYTSERLMALDVKLEGLWKFKTGNKNQWKEIDFNDKDWADIIVPGYWETQGYKDYNGFAWYRREFIMPENMKDKKLILTMGKIDDIDEVYINGKLVGSTGVMKDDPDEIDFHNEYSQFRGYYISSNDLLYNKKNVIAVKVYDGYINGGIYEGPVGIITQSKYVKYWRKHKREKNIFDLFFGD